MLTARGDSAGYGRIVRDGDGEFLRIVEERDATPAERAIDEYNSGCYAFDGTLLADAIKRVTTDNSSSEEYLTDVVDILRGDGHRVGTMLAAESAEITGSTTGSSWPRRGGRSTTGSSGLDAGRGHHHRPRIHLDRRYRHHRAGRRDRPADPARGRDRRSVRGQGRTGLPA